MAKKILNSSQISLKKYAVYTLSSISQITKLDLRDDGWNNILLSWRSLFLGVFAARNSKEAARKAVDSLEKLFCAHAGISSLSNDGIRRFNDILESTSGFFVWNPTDQDNSENEGAHFEDSNQFLLKEGDLWYEIKKQLDKEQYMTLKWDILNYIFTECREDSKIKEFFKNLNGVCKSGKIFRVANYPMACKFFTDHYEEIEALIRKKEKELGKTIEIEDNKVMELAWFGFEETARQLAQELGLKT